MRKRILVALVSFGSAGALMALSHAPSEPNACANQDAQADQPQYVGAMACRKCHGDQHKDWKKSNMANAFEVLKPGERAEEKTKAGLDPKKDYTKDETCLPCHVTGWGKPGGYAIPPEGDSPEEVKERKRVAGLEGVQCESCHGPASKSAAFKKTKEEYQWSEVEGLDGVQFPVEATCTVCHNSESPFVPDDFVFDFKARRDEGTHVHNPMDFEHGCPHEHTVTKKKRKKKKR